MKDIQCIIVEDEKRTRNVLRTLLEKYTEGVEVLAEAENVPQAVKLINEIHPDIVFLDIEMPGENGFELFNYFDEINFDVVFTTAYEQYAVKAIKLAALDYLVKPINLEELHETINRYRSKTPNNNARQKQHKLLNTSLKNNDNQRIALPCSEGIMFVEISDIVRCQSDKSYTLIVLQDGQELWSSKNLGEYDLIFENYGFVRVHRSHLINTKFVKSMSRGKAPILVMTDDSRIPVANSKKDELINHILGA